MLHSTLPRAFLPPVLHGYAAGYCLEEPHQLYATASGYVPCIDDPYSRLENPEIRRWESPGVRPTTPSPLDLSVKPSSALDERSEEIDEIEVDDEEVAEDAKCRASQRQRGGFASKRSYSDYEDLASGLDEADAARSESVHSYRSGDGGAAARKPDELAALRAHPIHEEIFLRGHQIHAYPGYESLAMKREMFDPREVAAPKLQPHDDPRTASESYGLPVQAKLHLPASPSGLRGQSAYHQQLLMTPQQQHHLQAIHAPMTPPSTPSPPQCPRRRPRDDAEAAISRASSVTPKQIAAPPADKSGPRPKKKHARRLKFDEDTSSPVSGTVILGPDEAVVTGDIDPAFNIVEVTEEARAELAKIENRLGPYQCKLCRQLHDDAFQLAQHRCSRIAHVEYRCPECDKRFSCPANLASHRRWHKPRIPSVDGPANASSSAAPRDPDIPCTRCDAKFTRPAALRKHLAAQHPEPNNNLSIANNNNDDDNNSGYEEIGATAIGKSLCIAGPAHVADATVNGEMP